MAAPLSASLSLYRHLRRPPPQVRPPSPLFKKCFSSPTLPAVGATVAVLHLQSPLPSALPRRRFPSFPPPPPPRKPLLNPVCVSLLHSHSGESRREPDDGDVDDKIVEMLAASESQLEFDDDDDFEDKVDDFEDSNGERMVQVEGIAVNKKPYPETSKEKPPVLTVKEKKELASYAHSLGKKLKIQQVGKSGVTASLVSSFVETLEANELLKIKIHGNCPGELDDAVKQLEEATGSVVVGQIGRTVILYRPSLSKLKAEEEKKQARRIFVRREFKAKPLLLQKARAEKVSGRGHRGSSRFSS